ncbi:XK-related protein 9 [Corythoichthys intestinalis]|uniref:XK-related protein 9 n=1 Tax=Corythoichthys intestinalis TaxID=161448 RepID=UPI0025A6613C|nr:XK-related protein 9 [Corythoichthys intestinalis]XP_061809764.1 XK-related protein 9-like [Nerophis lumbriciformis]
MLQTDIRYTKLRWLLTVLGLLLYFVDIWTDVGLSLKYLLDEQYICSALTFSFVLFGLLVTQIFSHAWYEDDIKDAVVNPRGEAAVWGISSRRLMVIHVCGVGIFTRYYHLLKNSFGVVWISNDSLDKAERREVHYRLFCHATDLSMLKLFEAFLESAPQLLLQIYIIQDHGEASLVQYFSMIFSFFNISWALVDYRRCLRRSLPHIQEMPSGLPTAIYLLYKLCTIGSHILSYSLLLVLNPYCVIALVAFLWLLGTLWSHVLGTHFCTTRRHEIVYRIVVGFILTNTFFNVKGKDTKRDMAVYYIVYSFINMTSPLLLGFLKPEVQKEMFFLVISGFIIGGTVLGMVFLLSYYGYMHPREKKREADEVDGIGNNIVKTSRMSKFLQP